MTSLAHTALSRARAFAAEHHLTAPILLAPMAGACPPSLSIAVANAGGLGAGGMLMMTPAQISEWTGAVRAGTNGAFQLNTWIPDPEPQRDRENEAEVRAFLGQWGPEVAEDAADQPAPDFDGQCDAMLAAGPAVISSIMGIYPQPFVERMKQRGIRWFATATTVAEALEAEQAGADVIIAQGMEAGGHRGAFSSERAESTLAGLFSLLPAVVDAVKLPVAATGGIADARGAAAALLLGASAVQIGTGFLRTPEAGIHPAWADAIGNAAPEDTIATRAFSGRLGRSLRTRYAQAAAEASAPHPAPYPIQRHLTQTMRTEAGKAGDIERMQAWAGQSARLAPAKPAGELLVEIWQQAQAALS